MSERKTLDQLATEIESCKFHNAMIQHVKNGDKYRIVDVYHRESDMALSVLYSPIGDFFGRVKFGRSVEEMDFGTRFVFIGGPVT